MEGWEGWDQYAPFYDWENAQTVGRQDVAFWRRLAGRVNEEVLELGCGTGRLTLPVARTGVPVTAIDRSEPMLRRARQRLRRSVSGRTVRLARADIRALPVRDGTFGLVMAPYGVLQSLVRESDLRTTLEGVARALRPGGLFGVDLVPDVPRWAEHGRRVTLQGRHGRIGSTLTLMESVRQDRARRLTIFEQHYVERRGRVRTVHRFSLVFRTLSVPQMIRRIERAGFTAEAVLGDYNGTPWDKRADVWMVIARRR